MIKDPERFSSDEVSAILNIVRATDDEVAASGDDEASESEVAVPRTEGDELVTDEPRGRRGSDDALD